MVEWLLQTPAGLRVKDRILSEGETVHVPHLLDLEVVQTLRRLTATHRSSYERAQESLRILRTLPLKRYDHLPLLGRVWALRVNLTAYDGVYIALAEALAAPLVTCDAKIAAAAGHGARVELI